MYRRANQQRTQLKALRNLICLACESWPMGLFDMTWKNFNPMKIQIDQPTGLSVEVPATLIACVVFVVAFPVLTV